MSKLEMREPPLSSGQALVAEVLSLAQPADLPHCGFGRLLSFLAHVETLLGVPGPVKCLLD